MLVVTRRTGEGACIRHRESGKVIANITIVCISKGKMRLGLKCPEELEILRDEILAKTEPEGEPCLK